MKAAWTETDPMSLSSASFCSNCSWLVSLLFEHKQEVGVFELLVSLGRVFFYGRQRYQKILNISRCQSTRRKPVSWGRLSSVHAQQPFVSTGECFLCRCIWVCDCVQAHVNIQAFDSWLRRGGRAGPSPQFRGGRRSWRNNLIFCFLTAKTHTTPHWRVFPIFSCFIVKTLNWGNQKLHVRLQSNSFYLLIFCINCS